MRHLLTGKQTGGRVVEGLTAGFATHRQSAFAAPSQPLTESPAALGQIS